MMRFPVDAVIHGFVHMEYRLSHYTTPLARKAQCDLCAHMMPLDLQPWRTLKHLVTV